MPPIGMAICNKSPPRKRRGTVKELVVAATFPPQDVLLRVSEPMSFGTFAEFLYVVPQCAVRRQSTSDGAAGGKTYRIDCRRAVFVVCPETPPGKTDSRAEKL
jgi:hypothetical protein